MLKKKIVGLMAVLFIVMSALTPVIVNADIIGGPTPVPDISKNSTETRTEVAKNDDTAVGFIIGAAAGVIIIIGTVIIVKVSKSKKDDNFRYKSKGKKK